VCGNDPAGQIAAMKRAVIVAQARPVRSRRTGLASPSRANPRCSSRTAVSGPRGVNVISTSVASLGSKNRCQR
jgi:hypothetical protein